MNRDTRPVPYFTKGELVRLNDAAIAAGRNRTVDQAVLAALEEGDYKFPVVLAFVHNDQEMRCGVVLDVRGTTVWLDLSLEDFAALPRSEV